MFISICICMVTGQLDNRKSFPSVKGVLMPSSVGMFGVTGQSDRDSDRVH